ncbi:MAG: archease [Deltaproteobacteria bacterium]|nr:archease [Deltaproteobacteria bacterium]
MKYRLIDHTADFGIHVFGSDLKGLFTNAAKAMFDQITIVKDLQPEKELKIHVTGSDWPDLMINWLRELLYLWTGKERLVGKVNIFSISEYELSATVKYDTYNPDRHVITNDIKAVTYHQIQVNRAENGWDSRIIFDV